MKQTEHEKRQLEIASLTEQYRQLEKDHQHYYKQIDSVESEMQKVEDALKKLGVEV